MPTLITFALLLTMFSMAFPVLLIPAAALWFLLIRTALRRVSAARIKVDAKAYRKAQATYDKGVRYFS